ncbi:peptidyl-prolyl cis-trans isomerase [uncultured Paenibacillus sp.]|uniref:peptidylprolyl isomerase n=1 Tax=uncultured Paenibacillus sp. TaxID=227322 RepID=UPI0015AF70A5|nr:peptidyl-prolyl cis-trans isomerase [uncultured Paenibacillus sp.]
MEEKDKRKLDFAEGEAETSEEETLSPEGQAGQEEGGATESKAPEYDPADDADFVAEGTEAGADSTPVMVSQQGEPEAQTVQTSKSGSKVWPIVSLILAVLLIVVLIKPPFVSNKAEAVATVNGVEITKDRLFDELAASGGEQALTNLINQELVNQEAAKKNITVTDADIDAEIESYKTQFGSEEALNQALVQYGMTMDDLRKQVVMELKLTKLLEPQIKVTDEQVKETFESYKDSFNTPEQVRTSVILVATEQEAKDIVKQLDEGADFAELAKSKSLDAATKEQGGDTDFFGRGEKEEAVETAAFKLAKGEVSEPVKTSEGYQVIKVTDKKEAHTATLEEKKEEIRKGLVSQQVSSLSGTWLEDVRSKAKITNTLTDAAAAE